MTFPSRGQPARTSACITLATLLLCAGMAIAAPETPGQPSRRTVRLFNFDDADNPDPFPPRWFRVYDNPQGERLPGFPPFNLAILDNTVSASGTASVKLPTRGGSTRLRVNPGEIAIFSDADYAVTAQVRTTELKHARAFLVARLLDQQLRPLPGGEFRSEPILAPGAWTIARVVVPGHHAGAAWMQLDLELLQPKQFEQPGALDQYKVQREDVEGAAWFDDVAVSMIPRTRFFFSQPSGLAVGAEKPALNVQVRDDGGTDLSAVIRVFNTDGAQVAAQSLKIDPSARITTWTPALPGFGWYNAVLDVQSAGASLSRSELAFAHIPSRSEAGSREGGSREGGPGATADLRRFGLIADTISDELLPQLPDLVARAGTGFVVLPAFTPAATASDGAASLEARRAVLDTLLARGQSVTLALGSVPIPLATTLSLDTDDALRLAESDPKAWMPLLDPALDVFGQRVLRYQLGRANDERFLSADATRGATNFEHAIARLVPGPMISIPWRADYPPPQLSRAADPARQDAVNIAPGALIDGVTLTYPTGFPPAGMDDLAARWRTVENTADSIELTIVPELLEGSRYGQTARVIDAAQRIIEFWAAFGERQGAAPDARIALNAPWTIGADGHQRRIMPGPTLSALAAIAPRLSGRRVVGTLPAAPGVRAFILARRSRDLLSDACIVAWNESETTEHVSIEVIPAGQNINVYDVFGNRERELPRDANGSVAIDVGESPLFIEGVDPYLALFAGSFRLEPRFVPAEVTEHDHRIIISNPWPIRISGKIQLKEADIAGRTGGSADWTITPNVMDFEVAPGQQTSLPLSLAFGPGQLAGSKEFVIVARVLADRQYPPVRLRTEVEVGLRELELAPEAHRSPTPDGPDIVVIAAVTNKDTRPRTLRLETAARNAAAQQLQISDLPPGQTTLKRFVFRDGAKSLSGRRVIITLTDTESPTRLNKAVMIP